MTLEDRFWRRVFMPLADECCWEWTGYRDERGYGRLSSRVSGVTKTISAHRLSWQIYKGEIPPGLCVLHKCDNPPCVNPDHLFLGNQRDNMLDCSSKGRLNNGNSLKTHCPKGHPYVPVAWRKSGRGCRICENARNLRRYHLKRLAP